MEKPDIFDGAIIRLSEVDTADYKVVLGFDGFVDNVVYVVDKRLDDERYERIPKLKDYGERIIRAAGKSLNIEMVPIRQKLGGNGPILANSLIRHGCDVTYIGALGKNALHPVFQDMADKAAVYSISDPGNTDAIEFLDGKIISSQLEPLKEVCWHSIEEKVGTDRLAHLFNEADLIGFENWTLLIHMTDLWKHIISEVLPLMDSGMPPKMLFIDLADPEKRRGSDLLEALSLLKEFSKTFSVILGLNYKEAEEISQLLAAEKSVEPLPDTGGGLCELAEYIRRILAISQVVVHSVREACVASEQGIDLVKGPYCESPVLTTGAGDNFNAGYVLGLLIGCKQAEALLLGTANSGYYVRYGESADRRELKEFVTAWRNGELE